MPLRGLSAVPFVLLLWASAALGHARLTSPTPRSPADDIKDFNGGLARCTDEETTVRPTVVVAGSVLRVTWDETVNHPGCFVLSLRQQPDGEFKDLATIAHSNTPPSPTQQNPRKYSADVQLPDVACEHCVLLLRQLMLGTQTEPCPPANIPTGATYYSCADLRLVPPGTDAGVEGDGGSEPGPDDGTEDMSGCGCGSSSNAAVPLFVLVGTAHVLSRRRRG